MTLSRNATKAREECEAFERLKALEEKTKEREHK